jgi:glycosyltransferase involved in cell wall biosynthesis
VLVVGRDLTSRVGGGETYVMGHALACVAAGFEPHLVSVADRAATLRSELGVQHLLAAPLPRRSPAALLHRRRVVRAVRALLADHPGPHVVHGFGPWADAAVAASRALARTGMAAVPLASAWASLGHETAAGLDSALVRRTPRLALRQGAELAWVRLVAAPLEGRALRACAEVVVNYDSVAALLREAYGPGLPLRTLPYAAPAAFGVADAGDEERRADGPTAAFGVADAGDAERDADPPLVVSVSRHDGRKGLDVLLHALAGLRDDGVPFRAVLAGDGVLLERHRALARELALGDHVMIPGRVPDVMPHLRRAAVFVLPSTTEDSGSLSVLEALVAGAPVVATAIDGLPEDLTHERDALLVPPGDAGALRDALARLLRDPGLRRRLANGGRELHERRFSAERATEAVAELYARHGLHPA